MSHSPSPAEIKTNIEECERMKTLSIRDAEENLFVAKDIAKGRYILTGGGWHLDLD